MDGPRQLRRPLSELLPHPPVGPSAPVRRRVAVVLGSAASGALIREPLAAKLGAAAPHRVPRDHAVTTGAVTPDGFWGYAAVNDGQRQRENAQVSGHLRSLADTAGSTFEGV